MAKTIAVCGYGPGISEAVARRFGAEGFQVALVGRNAERVAGGAEALVGSGVSARGFACDLGDPAAVRRLISDIGASLGPVTVLHWNAYSPTAGDLLNCTVDELRSSLDVGVSGLVVAVQEALPGMKAQEAPAVLVTGGGFAFYDPKIDAMTVQYHAMGLGLSKAAQHKLVGMLHQRLAGEGVYVGEVVVLGAVRGTAFDRGQAALDPNEIAGRFWQLYQDRSDITVNFG